MYLYYVYERSGPNEPPIPVPPEYRSMNLSEASRKFIFQLSLDPAAVTKMLQDLPYLDLNTNSMPVELQATGRYFEELQEIRSQRLPVKELKKEPLECNIELSACVRLDNAEEFYNSNGIDLDKGNPKWIERALRLENSLSEAIVKCEITLQSVKAMDAFYMDYKGGILDLSFKRAVLGSPADQQDVPPGQPRYSMRVGLSDRRFWALRDRMAALEALREREQKKEERPTPEEDDSQESATTSAGNA